MHENKEAIASTQRNPGLPIARQKLLQYFKIHLELEFFMIFQNFMHVS
jgi:hypothetical protein